MEGICGQDNGGGSEDSDPELESKAMYAISKRSGVSWLELEDWPPHWVRALARRVLDEIRTEQRQNRKQRGVKSLGDMLG